MAMTKETLMETLATLENLLTKCIEKEETINIHGNINGLTIRYSSLLDEFYISHDEFSLVCGWFEVTIHKTIVDISYDKVDKSIYIVFQDGELYIDLE